MEEVNIKRSYKCPFCGSKRIKAYPTGPLTKPCFDCLYCGGSGIIDDLIKEDEAETMKENKPDVVNHPSHYAGKIECIDYIRDKLTPEGFTEYCIGNVLKYVSRWRKKDGIQDLKKAAVYLNWAIESAAKEEAFADKDAAQRGDQDVLAPAT